MRVDLIQQVFDSGRAAAAEEIRNEFQKYEECIAKLQMKFNDQSADLREALRQRDELQERLDGLLTRPLPPQPSPSPVQG